MKMILILLALAPLTASAQLFHIKVTDYGVGNTTPLERAFRAYIDTELVKVEADVNEGLPSGSPTRLMQGMANSSVMAGKGIGIDYASKIDVFLVGAGVGVAADLHKDKQTKSDLSGAAVAPGFVLGTNLSWMDSKRFLGMDTDRLNLFVNFMKYDINKALNNTEGEKSSAELDMLALGVHFRYDWIKGSGSKLLGWGGVKFNFGYEYNKNDISFKSQITKDAGEFGNGPNGEVLTGTIAGTPIANIQTATHSIPIALSTDVQLLYFLTLYTGVGVDYSFGQAKGKGNLNTGESTITCQSGGICSGQQIKVQPQANIDATGKVTAFTTRGFVGMQFNIPFVRVFVQADKALGSDVIGATAGLRFVY
jgi:hypothetical protein